MTPDEIKDYNALTQIQDICNSAKSWDGEVSFEEIWQKCSDQKKHLKFYIGHRIVKEEYGE